MRLTKSQSEKYVEDFYESKYELIKYNQCEFSHLCIKLFFHYNHIYIYMYVCVCPRPALMECADTREEETSVKKTFLGLLLFRKKVNCMCKENAYALC